MEKVIFEGNVVKSATTNKVVGKIIPSRDQCIDVILNNGCHQYAYYGTADDEGNFFNFCRDTRSCGHSCYAANNPKCRYNRKYQHNAGYYVDTAANESTY